jgi:DNA-binding NtrC family response regulator
MTRRRGDTITVPPSQIVQVLELLRSAEHMIERLSREVIRGRGIVRFPREGYPLKLIERDAILQALEVAGWVQCDAARLLGVSGRVLNYKIHSHGIQMPPDVRRRRWKVQE